MTQKVFVRGPAGAGPACGIQHPKRDAVICDLNPGHEDSHEGRSDTSNRILSWAVGRKRIWICPVCTTEFENNPPSLGVEVDKNGRVVGKPWTA